jgi:hypothetical protein
LELLPLCAPAYWFGMGRTAELELQRKMGSLAIQVARRMHFGSKQCGHSSSSSTGLPAMRGTDSDDLAPQRSDVDDLLRRLPASAAVDKLEDKAYDKATPVGRFRAQESRILVGLSRCITVDLGHCLEYLSQRRRETEQIRSVLKAVRLATGGLPLAWTMLLQHDAKFGSRELVSTVAHCVHSMSMTDMLDLRATLRPSGLLSALRLARASQRSMALESLELHVIVPCRTGQQVYGLVGLGLEWDVVQEVFVPTHDALVTALPPCSLSWELPSSKHNMRAVPLLWHSNPIEEARVPCATLPEMDWLQCGAALLIESPP